MLNLREMDKIIAVYDTCGRQRLLIRYDSIAQTNESLLDGIDKESISSSDESETNQSYLNNNSNNLNNSNIYLENSIEISSISEASEQKSTKLFSYKENLVNPLPFKCSIIPIINCSYIILII